MRRVVILALVALMGAVMFASCGGGGSEAEVRRTSDGRIVVTVWHSMPNPTAGSLQRIADEFNESQSEYQAELIFQGTYTESLNKLISSIGSGDIPSVIQLSDVNTQIMIDSREIVPAQEFIDAEEMDLDDFDPKALEYYRVDGTLYAMPFNLAGPILYYDRRAFEAAGLDPDEPPRTLAEVREYSERLVGEGVTAQGISLQISAWIFEQMLAKSGALYVNNDNGRESRATEAVFAGEEGKRIISWWDEMVENGLAYNAGDDTVDAMLKLASGETAMAIASTAALRPAIAAITLTGGDPRQYDTAPLPGSEAESGGVVLGGAALWILRDRAEEERQGAWEFVQFASNAEQQAQWHAETGYFPSRLSSYDLPPAVQAREEFPQFLTAVEQLRASPDNAVTRGALLGPFNAVRDRIARAFERVLSGNSDPQQELESAAADATQIIEEYNQTAP